MPTPDSQPAPRPITLAAIERMMHDSERLQLERISTLPVSPAQLEAIRRFCQTLDEPHQLAALFGFQLDVGGPPE